MNLRDRVSTFGRATPVPTGMVGATGSSSGSKSSGVLGTVLLVGVVGGLGWLGYKAYRSFEEDMAASAAPGWYVLLFSDPVGHRDRRSKGYDGPFDTRDEAANHARDVASTWPDPVVKYLQRRPQ